MLTCPPHPTPPHPIISVASRTSKRKNSVSRPQFSVRRHVYVTVCQNVCSWFCWQIVIPCVPLLIWSFCQRLLEADILLISVITWKLWGRPQVVRSFLLAWSSYMKFVVYFCCLSHRNPEKKWAIAIPTSLPIDDDRPGGIAIQLTWQYGTDMPYWLIWYPEKIQWWFGDSLDGLNWFFSLPSPQPRKKGRDYGHHEIMGNRLTWRLWFLRRTPRTNLHQNKLTGWPEFQ